jgi:hypothetical protein
MGQPAKIARNHAAEPYVPRIQALVEEGRVREARALAQEALQENPSEPGLRHWSQVLSPARARVSKEVDIDRTADFRWLEAHADSYPEQWVAVLDGDLVAHAPTLRELQSTLDEKAPHAPVLLHRFP